MNKFTQIVIAFFPLLATPLLAFGIAEGILNFGAGDKDILWVFVWGIWAILFAAASIVFIYKNWRLRKWLVRSTLVSIGILLVLWLFVFAASLLGIL